MAPNEDVPVPEDADKYEMAFKELIRVMEAAASSGAESIGMEWQGDDLLVFHASEGHVASKFPKHLQLEVIAEIVRTGTHWTQAQRSSGFPSTGKNTAWPSRNTKCLPRNTTAMAKRPLRCG